MTHEEFGATRIPSALQQSSSLQMKNQSSCHSGDLSQNLKISPRIWWRYFLALGFVLRLKFVLAETRKNLIESLILYLLVSLSFFIILRVYKVDIFRESHIFYRNWQSFSSFGRYFK